MKHLNIKLFADGADINSILKLSQDNRIKGFTTNPTLMRKAGIKDYRSFAKEVLSHINDKPISFEVFADEFDQMEVQANEIASWGDNVYVKIPVMNTRGEPSYDLINKLSHNNVKLNVTAVFTIDQTTDISNALQGGALSIISIFAGRIADTGRNPVPLMEHALHICKSTDPNIELLWASPREVYNVIEAERCGCDIITATPDILSKIDLFDKDLTDFSRETVLMFKTDSDKAGYTL